MPLEIFGADVETSQAVDFVAALVRQRGRKGASKAIDELFARLSNVDGAALAYDWTFWGRPKQIPSGDWESCLYLTGRGFGKTSGIARWINGEVEAGRVRSIGLAAQDEDNSAFLQVLGPSGLIATAPPWFRPEWLATARELVWPNGARAYVRTPEVPGKIRGYDYDLSWLSELQSWPAATREEALMNFRLATRIGLARMLYDATPKRRHPLLRALLAECARDPIKHREIRGSTYENAINLAPTYIETIRRQFAGTTQGEEEILGRMLEDSDGALVRQAWIDAKRRPRPGAFTRRVVAIDPAVTSRKSSDTTGVIVAGLGADGQAYVLRNLTGKYAPHDWGTMVLDQYQREDCDCVIVETNKGGEMVSSILLACAERRGLSIVEVGRTETPVRQPRTVNLRSVYSTGAKDIRALPVATAYQRGRVSHVLGESTLASLEDTLTTWEPGPHAESPGDLDALTFAIVELLRLHATGPDPAAAVEGIGKAQAALEGTAPRPGGLNLPPWLRGTPGRGSRI